MSTKRYPEEFRIEAVKQVSGRRHAVADVDHSQLPQAEELCRLKAELKRVTVERVSLKKPQRSIAQPRHASPSRRSFRWKANPHSARELDNQHLLLKLEPAWQKSGGVYAYRKIRLDMWDLGEACGKHRVYRLRSTCMHGRWMAGPWAVASTPIWCWLHCRWRFGGANPRHQ